VDLNDVVVVEIDVMCGGGDRLTNPFASSFDFSIGYEEYPKPGDYQTRWHPFHSLGAPASSGSQSTTA
jgi:hypothetical protein